MRPPPLHPRPVGGLLQARPPCSSFAVARRPPMDDTNHDWVQLRPVCRHLPPSPPGVNNRQKKSEKTYI